MSLTIHGIGTAVPTCSMTQEEALGLARVLCCRTNEQMTWVPLMYTQTGINRRHLTLPRALLDDVLHGTRDSHSIFLPTAGAAEDNGPTTGQRMAIYDVEAAALAVRAARQVLAQTRFSPEVISHLVTVSCTGFKAPGVDYALIQALGLPPTVERTHVGFMGCHGALNGLRVANAFTSADPDAVVLLCAVELCSLHYHYGWDPQRIVANALFADGAAALVGTQSETSKGWKLVASGSCVIPNSADAMGWTVGDHGFEMNLSKQVPRLIAQNLRPWLESWLAKRSLYMGDVASWAIHPGGPRILEAVEEALGLPRSATADAREVFAAYGNMSSPTVLFILDHLRRKNAPRPCVALGFGPGMTAEAALFQ